MCPNAFHDHAAILRMLWRVCTSRVIFSARLDVDSLPRRVQAMTRRLGGGSEYTQERFLAQADALFRVRQAGRLGRFPLLVMDRNSAAAG
jgi:hypothetical protein